MLFFMKILTQKSITHIEDDSMQDENEEPEVTDNILDDEDYIPDVTFQDINGEQCLRRSERQKKEKRFTDFVTYLSKVPPTTPEAEGCSICVDVPVSVAEALSRPDSSSSKQAMFDEMQSFADNNTWEMVDLPDSDAIVECKWVFKVKLDSENRKTYRA